MTHPAQVVLTGFFTCISLIFAIGAQNAFVLRQGIKGEHVFWVCLLCATLDGALMALGVGGFHLLVQRWPWIMPLSRYGGAAFLLWYGWRNAVSAWRGTAALEAGNGAAQQTLGQTLLACLMLSLLNPHVYLDTVVLIGTISARYDALAWFFWLGAALMLVVDDLARTLTQAEIPIGIITALLGAPLFTFLLVQSRRRSTAR